ncbi:MAG: formate C-acetyltransferase/glycerol dehydratase family glycyl radical enzyme [Desulfobacterales bacterium]|nr:formate C-acetyltransferase/glycerol dehydratase family glycyl radical enzyme [Desulfobacterales bacterium]
MLDITEDLKMSQRSRDLKARFFDHTPAICLEAAMAKTQVYKETEGEDEILRRAKSFLRICETKTIQVEPNELIVGNAGRTGRCAVIHPELAALWLIDELDTISFRSQDPYAITEIEKEVFREEIFPYWKGKTVEDFFKNQVPSDSLAILNVGGVIDSAIKYNCVPGDFVPDFPFMLSTGLDGVAAMAEQGLSELDLAHCHEDYDKKSFLESVLITCRALTTLAQRHGKSCELAAQDADPKRAEELRQMAANCRHIAHKPAETFGQAVQMVYFILIGLHIEGNAGGYSLGRLDQYLYPYYKADVDAGRLNDQEALDILESFWVKTGEQIWYWCEEAAHHYAGFCAFQNICVGGTDINNNDAVNELSYLMLQATIHLQMVQPSVSVRLSRKNPEDFFLKIAELIQTGSGFPSIHSDTVGIQTVMKKGVPPEVAREWAPIGCVEAQVPGKTYQWSSSGHYNLGAVMEFVFTNGVHRKSGEKIGLETGDPMEIQSYDEFENRVYRQIDHLFDHFNVIQNLLENLHSKYLQNPLASLLTSDCVKNGKDLTRGGARYNSGPGMNGNGVADFIDSMNGVRRLVFQEKKMTMAELTAALEDNFQGHEKIHRLLSETPYKWGNGIGEADGEGSTLFNYLIKKCRSYKGLFGNNKLPALYPVSSNVPQGISIGALPSGRKAYTPLADGCSPCPGADLNGPTGVLQSLSTLPYAAIDGGTLLNMKFTPGSVEGEAGQQRLSAFMKTFLDMDLFHIQFNVVGQKTLRCAQERPQDYKSLLIRVAGYSAYFVELSREVQDDIISRTIHDL